MPKSSQLINVLNWLKFFTYFSATVLLITNNSFNKLTYLIPLVLILFFVNYFRNYYLVDGKKPIQYVWISIMLEMLLIIGIGFLSKSDINLLFFFVSISSIVITYPFVYSFSIAVVYIITQLFLYTITNGYGDMMKSIIPMLFSYGVSIAFVMGMSYIVKMQVREKEKLEHINNELEQAYKKLIDNSVIAQKLTVEQERTRIAREIHDTLAYTLTTLIVELEVCKKLAPVDALRLPAELEKAQELSRSGFNDVKRSIKALRPQVMEDKSFFDSIISIINDFMENTKVHITLNNLLPHNMKLTSQIEVAIFRAIQESVTNSVRHGKSDEIEISIKQDKNRLELYITDNETGCTNIKKGYGIQGIRERIESLSETTEFSSSYGKGFKTRISIPIEDKI